MNVFFKVWKPTRALYSTRWWYYMDWSKQQQYISNVNNLKCHVFVMFVAFMLLKLLKLKIVRRLAAHFFFLKLVATTKLLSWPINQMGHNQFESYRSSKANREIQTQTGLSPMEGVGRLTGARSLWGDGVCRGSWISHPGWQLFVYMSFLQDHELLKDRDCAGFCYLSFNLHVPQT